MIQELRIERTIPASREEVFRYFVTPKLLERWSAPGNMNLKVPVMEAQIQGKYRYEHSDDKDLYVCNGHFQEFLPNEKLVMIDNVQSSLKGPLYENLRTEIIFKDVTNGTRVEIRQSGFKNETDLNDCRTGWEDCLSKLNELISHKRFRPGQDLREQQVNGK